MYGLLGPNGAGKSTLLRTIATLQYPDAGSIRLGDIDVVREKDGYARRSATCRRGLGPYPRVRAERLLNPFAVHEGMTDARGLRELVNALLHKVN